MGCSPAPATTNCWETPPGIDAPLLTEGPQGHPWVCQGAQGSMQGLELSSSHLNVLLGFPN